MSTMTAATWVAPDEVRVEEVPVPEVPPGWALVEVAYNGICGTDLAILHGAHPRARTGLIPGHEVAGRVVRQAATGPRDGALVVVEPLISCGRCLACRSGAPHVCRELGLFGIDRPGAMARYVALPSDRLHEVPSHVPPRFAALVEPLAVAVHAVGLSALVPGDVVALSGAGPVGVLTGLVALHAGAARVLVVEPNPWRLAAAAGLGLTAVPEGTTLTDAALEATGGEGADVYLECSGHPATTPSVTSATRVRGRVVVVGVHKQPAVLDLRDVSFKELTLVGARVYTTVDVRRAVQLVAEGTLGLERLATRAFALTDVAAAFRAAAAGDDVLKVLVTPDPAMADA